jgi:glycosidase
MIGDKADPPEEARDGSQPDPHDYLRALRGFLQRRRGDAILLGEVNLTHEEQLAFFGGADGDELTMMFDFVVMQKLYLSLARQDATPLAEALRGRPVLPVQSQWANFVRNHDELTLDKLTDAEREEVFAAFGPDEDMQLYGRGLRRRLPPMLDGDPARIRLAYSLMFSLPGTPVLFYGEEIGMGENLDLPGRLAVRTPMQWSGSRNGGFSSADPASLERTPPEGAFGPDQVNVVDQRSAPGSLLSFFKLLVHSYRQSPELGWTHPHLLEQPHRDVLAHECRWDDRRTVLLHNLGRHTRQVPIRLDDHDGSPLHDVLGDGYVEVEADDGGVRFEVELPGYGYRWLRVAARDGKRLV